MLARKSTQISVRKNLKFSVLVGTAIKSTVRVSSQLLVQCFLLQSLLILSYTCYIIVMCGVDCFSIILFECWSDICCSPVHFGFSLQLLHAPFIKITSALSFYFPW